MFIDTFYKRGKLHAQHNEDALIHTRIYNCITIAAVMDGCSSAHESQFASQLYVKVIRKVSRKLEMLVENEELDLCSFSAEEFGNIFLGMVYTETVEVCRQLFLQTIEVLSTLMLAIYHEKEQSLWMNVSGDGVFGVDGEITRIDQQNVPDFMGYHLHQLSYEAWRDQHTQTYSFSKVHSFFISTDGIEKIKNRNKETISSQHLIQELTQQKEGTLAERFEQCTRKYACEAYDDVAVVQLNSIPPETSN